MVVRFFIDPDTGLPHISNHGIKPIEVLELSQGDFRGDLPEMERDMPKVKVSAGGT